MKINFSKDYPILIERGIIYTHCGQSGNDEPEKSYKTPKIPVEEQFKYIFHEELDVNPSEFKVVLVKDSFSTQEDLKEESNILFKNFNVKGLSFLNRQVGIHINLVSHGTDSIIIDIYDKYLKIVPIINMVVQRDDCIIIERKGKEEERVYNEFIKSFITIFNKFGIKFQSLTENNGDPYSSSWDGKVILYGEGENISIIKSEIIKKLLNSEVFEHSPTQNSAQNSRIVDLKFKDVIFTIHNTPESIKFGSWTGCSIISSLKPFKEFFITKEMFDSNPDRIYQLNNKDFWKKILNQDY